MIRRLCTFMRREDGAVTVDWVVLTAAIVSLAGLIVLTIQGSAGSVGSGVGQTLSDTKVE